jgi:phosphoribosylformylglycinamidine cyclo-ligase
MDKYKESGVNIEKAEKIVIDLKSKFPAIGGYAGVFPLGDHKLAATCDGVGTKIKIALELGIHDVIGEDLVAMSVNDLIAQGARPLFFLDYYACGRLNENIFNEVMKGIENGMNAAGCMLIGGETAEMPGMYNDDDYDLAGFACGIVEKEFKKDDIKAGDLIIGLSSTGIHSNGFSLVRKLFSNDELRQYKDIIMKPTRIYSEFFKSDENKSILAGSIKNMAHVTGGGINRALKRLLPDGLTAQMNSFELPEIFSIIEQKGVTVKEMEGIFNMGWGMLIGADKSEKERILDSLGGTVVGEVHD